MSSVKIVYSELKDSWKAADKAASYCESYANEIRKKVTNKISDFKGGGNGYTSNAASYASAKITALTTKASALRTYSGSLQTCYNEAKNTDRDVKNYLKLEGRDFRDSHDMHVNPVLELFVGFFITIANENPVFKWIKDSFRAAGDWLSETWQDIKYWYKCEGGKYVIKIIAAVVLLIAAVVVAVLAWPVMIAALSAGAIWASIVAVASFVGAVIAIADALIDLEYNIVALATFGSDPAWAARYDSFSSLAEWLKSNRFSSSLMNKWSYTLSTVVKVTKAVCAVIKFIDLGINVIKNIGAFKNGQLWSKVKSAYKAMQKSNAGTWAKIKYMTKSVFTDYKQIAETNATMYSRLKAYYNSADYVGKTLKGFSDATKTLKTISKFVINLDEKGAIKAIYDFGKGKTTYFKEIEGVYKDIKGAAEPVSSNIERVSDTMNQYVARVQINRGAMTMLYSGAATGVA